MKKIITSAIIAAFALLFSSCEKGTIEAETEVTRGRVVEISASMPETKVSVATTGKVTWSEGDQIAAFNTAGTKFEFDLVDGAGTTSGLFRCNSFEGDLGQTAVYPASYAGSTPGEIIYPSVKYYDVAEQVPVVMAAVLDGGSSSSFVQLGGVIELNMYDIPAYARAMVVKSGSNAISGTYAYNVSAPQAIVAGTGSPSSLEIRLPLKVGYQVNTKFYVPLPTGNFDDLIIQFLDGDEDVIEGTESISIPSSYGNVHARDYISMAQLNIRSKVTRAGYIKVEGTKWATGNLRVYQGGTDGTNFQTGWNIWDKQWKTEYGEWKSTEAISGVVNSYSMDSKVYDHFNWGGLSRSARVHNAGYIKAAPNKFDIAGKIYSVDTGATEDEWTAAEVTGDDRFTDVGTFQKTNATIHGDLAFWASKGQMRLPRSGELKVLRAGNETTNANLQAGYYVTERGGNAQKIYGVLITSSTSWETSTSNATAIELTDADMEAGLFLPKAGRRVNDNATSVKHFNGQGAYWSSTFGSNAEGFTDCVTVLGFNASNVIVYGYTEKWKESFGIGDTQCGNMIRPVIYNPSDEISSPKTAPTANSLRPWKKGEMDIHLINSARGECNFVIMPDGTSLVIDAGEIGENEELVSRKPSNDSSDPMFARVYKVYTTYMKYFLQNTRHNYIDYALATHYHTDHIGAPKTNYKMSRDGSYIVCGLSAIYEDIPIKTLVDRKGPGVGFNDFAHYSEDDIHEDTYNNYTTFAQKMVTRDGMVWQAVSEVNRDSQFAPKYGTPEASLKLIGYDYKYWNGSSFTTGSTDNRENGSSISMLLSYGDFNCYFGADCGAQCGYNIMRNICSGVGKVEVLKAPHHFAESAFSDTQAAILQPKVTVVSCFGNNTPNDACVTAADAFGDVFATNNGSGVSLKDAGGHLCVRVQGDGTFMVYKLKDTDYSYEVLASYGPYTCH